MSAVIIRLSDHRPPPPPQPEPEPQQPAPMSQTIWSPRDWWAAQFRIQGLALLLWAQSMEGRR